MKKILLICLFFLLPFTLQAQYKLWVTDGNNNGNTITMISEAADSVVSDWITYEDWKEFEGAASLWNAVYSYSDGLSDAVIIKYQLRRENDSGNYNVTHFITLDSLVSADNTTILYGSGDQPGKQISVADKADPWGPHEAIRFDFYWAPSSADTVIITSEYNPVER